MDDLGVPLFEETTTLVHHHFSYSSPMTGCAALTGPNGFVQIARDRILCTGNDDTPLDSGGTWLWKQMISSMDEKHKILEKELGYQLTHF